MKRILAMILALAMCFCFAACGSSQPTEETEPEEKKPVSTDPKVVITDEAKVEYTGYKIKEEYSYMYGSTKKVVELQFKFTSLGEKASAMYNTVNLSVYQNGVEIDNSSETGTTTQNVLPGYDIDCAYRYILQDTTSPIHVVYQTWGEVKTISEFDVDITA